MCSRAGIFVHIGFVILKQGPKVLHWLKCRVFELVQRSHSLVQYDLDYYSIKDLSGLIFWHIQIVRPKYMLIIQLCTAILFSWQICTAILSRLGLCEDSSGELSKSKDVLKQVFKGQPLATFNWLGFLKVNIFHDSCNPML